MRSTQFATISPGTLSSARFASRSRFCRFGSLTCGIAELAEREGIACSYMTRVLRLSLLAPDIVEAILDGKQGPEMTPAHVLEPFPMIWNGQVEQLA
ncbi:MAG: hypothetical protein EP318_19755 [Rhodobacteraceae bacterium]|nr:MAG: hypothetical protein EP318_19755 [Paracoccaceae bacterium]